MGFALWFLEGTGPKAKAPLTPELRRYGVSRYQGMDESRLRWERSAGMKTRVLAGPRGSFGFVPRALESHGKV